MKELHIRRKFSDEVVSRLQHQLSEGNNILNDNTCIYVTGSFGRNEACEHSDLDVFLSGVCPIWQESDDDPRSISRLDEICAKSALIGACREYGLPDFDGDGEYLQYYHAQKLIGNLGGSEDDYRNTFTARLLLLLESRPLVGKEAYDSVIKQVLTSYWRNFEGNEESFIPVFFVNDILRLWRTFCVNYEARTSSATDRDKIKRKTKNYKLKHSRLLTCFASILCMLVVFKKFGTVTVEDVVQIAKITPTERLEWLQKEVPNLGMKDRDERDTLASLNDAIGTYEKFLTVTNCESSELQRMFQDSGIYSNRMSEARDFGYHMANILAKLGQHSDPFSRYILI